MTKVPISIVGHECDKYIWYAINRYPEDVSKQSRRIMDLGTTLEPLIVRFLIQDGYFVSYNERQIKVEISISDKLILTGYHDITIYIDNQHLLADIKTMSPYVYKRWLGEAYNQQKYVAQIACYYVGLKDQLKLEGAAIVGFNRSNAEYSIKTISHDLLMSTFDKVQSRLLSIISSNPEPIEEERKWLCQYCGYRHLCLQQSEVIGDDEQNSD